MLKVVVPSLTRRPAALARVSESSSPEGPYLPKTLAARPEEIEAVPLVVRVLTVVGALSVVAAASLVLVIPVTVTERSTCSSEASARQLLVTLSLVRKPVPRPETEASPRISPRTALLLNPLPPVPCPAEKPAFVMLRLARPLPETSLSPAMTREPLVWTALSVATPVAVALALRKSVVPSRMLAIVVLGLIPSPVMSIPGMRPTVLGTVTLVEVMVVEALSEAFAKVSVVTLSDIPCAALAESSMRPPPLRAERTAMPSEVAPAAEPPMRRRPPCMLTVPPAAVPRRLLRLAAELSSCRRPPALTLKIELAEAVETKALPAPA